jgi:hypothetical protein
VSIISDVPFCLFWLCLVALDGRSAQRVADLLLSLAGGQT